jgi:hypothetical protein
VELEFDTQTQVLRQSKLYFPKGALYQYIVFDYTHVQKQATLALFKEAQAQVFDAQGNLLKKYRHYTVEQH